MQCVKCGRDVEPGEVFCEVCREVMQKYPVKPGTVVVLPHRPERILPKRPAKKVLTHEEQLIRSRKMNRLLACLLAVYLVITAALAYACGYLYTKYESKRLPGQNYSAIQDDEPEEPPFTNPGTGE